MTKLCVKCSKKVGAFTNVGSDDYPLCPDCCKTEIKCINCGRKLKGDDGYGFNDIYVKDSKPYCKECYENTKNTDYPSSHCPICNTDVRQNMTCELYGTIICKRHRNNIFYARSISDLFDTGLSFLVSIAVIGILTLVSSTVFISEGFSTYIIMILFFCFKDSFWGRSPGKFIFGLVVLDVSTKTYATPLASLKRNLPLCIPFIPILAGFQIFFNGIRIGDNWAKTMVVFSKDRNKFNFISSHNDAIK